MCSSARFGVIGLFLLAVSLPLFGQEKSGQDKKEKKPLVFAKDVAWKLDALNKEPLKLISTRHLPKEGAVYWIFELTRDFNVYEDHAYWGPAFKLGKTTGFRFELLDEDGVILRTADAHYIGEYVVKAGKRFAAYFSIPPELAPHVKTVIAIRP